MEQHVIVLKFSSYRPTLTEIRDSIHRNWGILGDFSLGLLDQRHVLVRLQSEAEAKKVLARDSFLIRGVRFKAFRWHDGFSLKADPISVPLWVELPNLPLHLFHPPLLKAIVNSFGGFLRMDDHTRCLSRPGSARVCVEMSLAGKLPNRIWIDRANNRGFWQKIEYPGFKYCDYCSLLGHHEEFCRKKLGLKGNAKTSNLVSAEKTENHKVEAKVIKQQYVPVANNNKVTKVDVGTSGEKNYMGVEIKEGMSMAKSMSKEPAKLVLSNKFANLTADTNEQENNLELPISFSQEKENDNDIIEHETTQEGLQEAGYSLSEIANAVHASLASGGNGNPGGQSGHADCEVIPQESGSHLGKLVLPNYDQDIHDEHQLHNTPKSVNPTSDMELNEPSTPEFIRSASVVNQAVIACSDSAVHKSDTAPSVSAGNKDGSQILAQQLEGTERGADGQNKDSYAETATEPGLSTPVSNHDIAEPTEFQEINDIGTQIIERDEYEIVEPEEPEELFDIGTGMVGRKEYEHLKALIAEAEANYVPSPRRSNRRRKCNKKYMDYNPNQRKW